MSALQKLLLLCNPGGFSVYQGSFRCALLRLPNCGVKRGESAKGRKEEVGGGVSEREKGREGKEREKENGVTLFLSFFVS